MKYSKTVQLSKLLAIAALVSGSTVANVYLHNSEAIASPLQLISQTDSATEKEQSAFFASDYNYWDAAVLADFWGQDLGETKARMGRKILWGGENVDVLNSYLKDAQDQALTSVEDLRFFNEYVVFPAPDGMLTYHDAVELAKFWGLPTPYDAKLQVEKRLILGDPESVQKAVETTRNADS